MESLVCRGSTAEGAVEFNFGATTRFGSSLEAVPAVDGEGSAMELVAGPRRRSDVEIVGFEAIIMNGLAIGLR